MVARLNIIICVSIIINLICKRTEGRLCNKTREIGIPEWYITVKIENYTLTTNCNPKEKCWGTRLKTERATRTKYMNVTTLGCCEGYVAIPRLPVGCKPICSKPCIKGMCIKPEECLCYPGYRRDLNDKYKCSKVCPRGCRNGVCIAPSFCKCDDGYRYDSITQKCEPVCNKICENGTCVAPDTCKCLKGYIIAHNDHCKAHCSNGCPHGSCISPETCVCDVGWSMNGTAENGTCQPICKQSCINGICVAPNNCECLPGYTKSDSQNKCLNSTCKGLMHNNVTNICELAVTDDNNMQGLEKWWNANWVYVVPSLLSILMAVIFFIVLYLCRSRNWGERTVPVQNIRLKCVKNKWSPSDPL